MNSYNWTNLFDKILRIIRVEYESVIAEIVDNSMDNNAENVLIRFSGKRWDDFSAVVLDDGVGFSTPEKLFNSFDLAIQDVAVNTVGEEKRTGINDIGMKLTPLSFCDSITVITRFDDGTIGSRTLSRESATKDDSYQTEDSPQESREFAASWELIENGKWKKTDEDLTGTQLIYVHVQLQLYSSNLHKLAKINSSGYTVQYTVH